MKSRWVVPEWVHGASVLLMIGLVALASRVAPTSEWLFIGAVAIAGAAVMRINRTRFFRWARERHEARQSDPSFASRCPPVPVVMPMHKRDAISLATVWRRAKEAGVDLTMWKDEDTWVMSARNPDGTTIELRPGDRYRYLTEWRGIESALLAHMSTLAKTEELDAVAEMVDREKAARLGT